MSNLVKNIGSLGVAQIANYALPLITIPYVTRIVGPENYGLIEFGTVVMLYFSAVVIYGFNLTGTRNISAAEDAEARSRIFSNILTTRLLLLLAATFVFAILLFVLPQFRHQKTLFLFGFPIVVGWAIYPEFLFQGLQKLHLVALVNFVVKLIAAVLILLLINQKEQYTWVLGINALAQIIVGMLALGYAFFKIEGIRFFQPRWHDVVAALKDGVFVFASLLFTRISMFGSVLFLGLLLSEYKLGLFAAAAKLITVSQSFVLIPLTSSLFPHLSQLYNRDKTEYKLQFNRFLIYAIAAMGGLTLFIWFFADEVVQLVFGADYATAATYLKYLGLMLIGSAVSSFYLSQGLLILKQDKKYLAIIVGFGALSILLYYLAIPKFDVFGAVWVKILVDYGTAITAFFYYQRQIKKFV